MSQPFTAEEYEDLYFAVDDMIDCVKPSHKDRYRKLRRHIIHLGSEAGSELLQEFDERERNP